MKKVININFQGRVIPIEETAFEVLKQYVDSLRRYFANEEGREEIINDIQDRIAELFNDILKNGATCVTDQDVESIIENMGRPEDLEAAEAEQVGPKGSAGSYTTGAAGLGSTEKEKQSTGYEPKGRLYRNDADKVLGGVCSGFANYLQIDPVVVRVLYVILALGSFGVCALIYFVLWIALPSKALTPNIRKRLFRNPDDRWLGGVCGGLAAYFNIDTWIPRLIFAAPFLFGTVFGVIGNVLHWMFWDFGHEWSFGVFNGIGGSLFIVYIILWAVLPSARTASEKLEMRGAKVDLESIRNTVQGEIQTFKEKAVKVGQDAGERAKSMGEELKAGSRRFAKEAGPAVKSAGYGFFRAIGMLFKFFFLFIAGIIAFSLVVGMMGIAFGSIGAYSVSSMFISGFWEHFFLYATIFLFLGIPVIALFSLVIRMIIGRRSRTPYLRYIFGTLWILGLVSAFCLAGLFFRDKRRSDTVTVEAPIVQPTHNRLIVKAGEDHGADWDNWDWGVHFNGYLNNDDDTLRVNAVRLNIIQSTDDQYHVTLTKYSRGRTRADASINAGLITYAIRQDDSVLTLPQGFVLGLDDHYRFQYVRVNVAVPLGKHITADYSVDRLNGFYVRDNDVSDDDDHNWENGVDYVMTRDGLQRADGKKPPKDDTEDEDQQPVKGAHHDTTPSGDHNYRYHPQTPRKVDSTRKQVGWHPLNIDVDNITSAFYRISCTL